MVCARSRLGTIRQMEVCVSFLFSPISGDGLAVVGCNFAKALNRPKSTAIATGATIAAVLSF